MGIHEVESAITAEARVVLNNRKLRVKDLNEWSTGELKAGEGEVVIKLPELKVNVCVAKEHDKRSN